MSVIKLYRHPLSGHSHRVEMFLSMLRLKYDLVDVGLKNGEQKTEAFLKMNCFGQVPVIEDSEVIIADSNAILVYLASTYDSDRTWLPVNNIKSAQTQRFLSLAAGKLASGPAAARAINVFGVPLNREAAVQISNMLLAQLNGYLQDKTWLVGDNPTIADLANYTYIKHAPEGDISLDPFTHIQSWLERTEALPGFLPMKNTPVGLTAA